MTLYELYDHEVGPLSAYEHANSKRRALRSSERKWESILSAALRGDWHVAYARELSAGNCALCQRYISRRTTPCPLLPEVDDCARECVDSYHHAGWALSRGSGVESLLRMLNELRALSKKKPLTIRNGAVYVGE